MEKKSDLVPVVDKANVIWNCVSDRTLATVAGSSLGAAAVPDVTLATTSAATAGRGGGPSSSIATAASFTNLTTNNFGTGGGSSNEMLAGASSASQVLSLIQGFWTLSGTYS